MKVRQMKTIRTVGLMLAALGFAVPSSPTLLAQGGGGGSDKTTAVVYVETNSPDGNAILAYRRDVKGRLSLLGTFPTVEIQHVKLKGEGSAFQLELDPTGEFLYVVTQRATPEVALGEGNNLHILRINQANGRVSEEGHSPYALPVLPPGTRPQGLAVMQPR